MKNLLMTLSILLAPQAQAELNGVHGMFLFGEDTTYASHLPMFHHPHDVQLILKVELENHPRSLALRYYEELKDQGGKYFTLKPQFMDLQEIMTGRRVQFRAQLFEGHFERGGVNLGPIVVHVSQILHSRKLDPNASTRRVDDYLVFGGGQEYYGVHLIKGKPSFDRIVSLAPPQVDLYPCRTRVCTAPIALPPFPGEPCKTRLCESNPVQAKVLSGSGDLKPGDTLWSFDITARVKEVLYEEFDELSH